MPNGKIKSSLKGAEHVHSSHLALMVSLLIAILAVLVLQLFVFVDFTRTTNNLLQTQTSLMYYLGNGNGSL